MKALRIITLSVLTAVLVGLFGWATVAGARMGDIMGVIVRKGDASVQVPDQVGIKRRLRVSRVVAPTDSWIVVHLDEDGMPGKRIGVAKVKAGETRDSVVKLANAMLTPNVLVAVHIDRGVAGKFEFDMGDKESSPDKPYLVEGSEVAMQVKVGESGAKTKPGEKTPAMK